MIEKEPVLGFLAGQVTAKGLVLADAEAKLNAMRENCWGGEEWMNQLLVMTASKAMVAAFEKAAEYVLSLEEG